jgi:hypothetical protein
MNSELDSMIEQWKGQTSIPLERLDTIRLAARSDHQNDAMTVEWWRSILTIPRSMFSIKGA